MNPLDTRPLYIQLKNELMDKIRGGVWKEKEQIPTELELMEAYKLGRDTVRKAIAILVQEGYLIKRRGKGTFVAKTQFSIGFEPLISLRHALRVRGLEETNTILSEGKEALTKSQAKRARISETDQVMRIFRLRSVEGRPLAIEESIFAIEGIHYEELDPHASISSFLLSEWKGQIERMEQVMVPRPATNKERELLDIGPSDHVLALERWIYVKEKQAPISYVSFIIPINEYDFSI